MKRFLAVLLTCFTFLQANAQLVQISDTSNLMRLRFGPGKRRQQQRREDCNNGDDDQKFDEGKAAASHGILTLCWSLEICRSLPSGSFTSITAQIL